MQPDQDHGRDGLGPADRGDGYPRVPPARASGSTSSRIATSSSRRSGGFSTRAPTTAAPGCGMPSRWPTPVARSASGFSTARAAANRPRRKGLSSRRDVELRLEQRGVIRPCSTKAQIRRAYADLGRRASFNPEPTATATGLTGAANAVAVGSGSNDAPASRRSMPRIRARPSGTDRWQLALELGKFIRVPAAMPAAGRWASPQKPRPASIVR